jgi:hypothetical protein
MAPLSLCPLQSYQLSWLSSPAWVMTYELVTDGATVIKSSTELPAVLAFFSCMGYELVTDGATIIKSSTELPAVLAVFSCMDMRVSY